MSLPFTIYSIKMQHWNKKKCSAVLAKKPKKLCGKPSIALAFKLILPGLPHVVLYLRSW